MMFQAGTVAHHIERPQGTKRCTSLFNPEVRVQELWWLTMMAPQQTNKQTMFVGSFSSPPLSPESFLCPTVLEVPILVRLKMALAPWRYADLEINRKHIYIFTNLWGNFQFCVVSCPCSKLCSNRTLQSVCPSVVAFSVHPFLTHFQFPSETFA